MKDYVNVIKNLSVRLGSSTCSCRNTLLFLFAKL